ncbi:MAG: coproporphyrinogen dehydrogenase HemZ [Christensenellales bacterium]
MTALKTDKPEFFSDICEVIRLFVNVRRIERTEDIATEGYAVLHTQTEKDAVIKSDVIFYANGAEASRHTYSCDMPSGALEYKRAAKRAAKISVYRALLSHFGSPPPWGSLTGIRPTKLLRDSEALLGSSGAKALFLDEFDVSPEKYELAKSIVDAQAGLKPPENALDIYIGIPFCTTRCAYCSFASYPLEAFENAARKYVGALLYELDAAKDIIGSYHIRALYIGGGTPTALDVKLLGKVLEKACELTGGAQEITVEAGRPDTIDEEKLTLIKRYGAGRISVNAQTLCDDTLRRIGRRHTALQFYKAYGLARSAGFDSVNVDLIAGLPGETNEFCDSLSKVIELSPENITVHTLAIKRSSAFAAANLSLLPADLHMSAALEKSREMLGAAGYLPYYMYRQKYMKGSHENTGYAKSGKECLYNIDNMEELCGVLAFGAGAISKRLFAGGQRIERAANVKELKEYIQRCAKMAEAKRALFAQPDL